MRVLANLLLASSLAFGHIGAPPAKTIAYGDYMGYEAGVHTFDGEGYTAHIMFTDSKVTSITIVWDAGNPPNFVTLSKTMRTLLNDEKVMWDVKGAERSGNGCIMYSTDKKYFTYTLLGSDTVPAILHLVQL